ncbi:MAG TPA: HAMP domain-containing sensor histidine kinase [Polyangiaceae bacterium]|nr:HAMP domain-containing sensor histidine kinase [Polyangiaceae bacterium]
MLMTVALVATLAFWDEEREASDALDDYAREQATLALSVGAQLGNRLAVARRDALVAAEDTLAGRPVQPRIADRYLSLRVVPKGAVAPPRVAVEGAVFSFAVEVPAERYVLLSLAPTDLLTSLAPIERPGALVVLVLPDGAQAFHATDGRVVRADEIREALGTGRPSTRLTRPQAARLGLPARIALAGLSNVDAGPLGRWGVAVVATAERLRDREQRAYWRLVLSVGVAAGLVLAFGGVALALQRKELELGRDLALATLRAERDERLERATKAAVMGTLAAGIAHEVGTPLGVILGRAEQLAGRVEGDERAERALRTIVGQAERIDQVVRGFLGLAQGESPAFDRHDPAVLARAAVELVAHRFQRAGVLFLSNVPDDLPRISCNARLLEQALVNLLLNACDACAPGGLVELAVTAGGGRVAFTVTDDGVGIRPEDAARATEPFFTTKPAGKGSGLGLAVASEIVNLHRGSLALGPRAPRGTTAEIRIPTAREADDAAP